MALTQKNLTIGVNSFVSHYTIPLYFSYFTNNVCHTRALMRFRVNSTCVFFDVVWKYLFVVLFPRTWSSRDTSGMCHIVSCKQVTVTRMARVI